MQKIRTLIVDDSAFMRKLIKDILSASPRIEILGTARNGEEALEKIKEGRPDVVTMDVEMPVLNGMDALKIIMKEAPVPVVMLSSTTKEGAENTLKAIQYGAADFVAKPSGSISLDLEKIGQELIQKVISASKVNIKNLTRPQTITKKAHQQRIDYSKIDPEKEILIEELTASDWEAASKKLVCIGTSTGGPRALQNVLTKLPAGIKAPILIVQHMPPGFTKSLADRLNSICHITVKEAEDGEALKEGVAYIAPGGFHLKVSSDTKGPAIKLDLSAPENGHRPSVDIMFESAADLRNFAKIAVIMTGMGADGTNGLIAMKKNGAVKAIAESEETSVVFGMPKAAIATKLVDEVQSADNIANTIMKYV